MPAITAPMLATCGTCLAMSSVVYHHGMYLFAQMSSADPVSAGMVPDALGTTIITAGGGGLVILISAIAKDFWAYKKQQIESQERQEKEKRESQERLETARLQIERMRVGQAKNDRITNQILDWMTEAYRTKTFPPVPTRARLTDDTRATP